MRRVQLCIVHFATYINIFLVDFLSKIMNAKNFRNKVHQIWLSIWYLCIFCECMECRFQITAILSSSAWIRWVKQNFKQHAKDWIRLTRNYPLSLRKKQIHHRIPWRLMAPHQASILWLKTLYPYIKLLRPDIQSESLYWKKTAGEENISIFHVFLVWMGKSIPRA